MPNVPRGEKEKIKGVACLNTRALNLGSGPNRQRGCLFGSLDFFFKLILFFEANERPRLVQGGTRTKGLFRIGPHLRPNYDSPEP